MESVQDGEPRYLTRFETARYLRVSERKLDQLIATGGLPAVRLGRAVRVDRLDADAYMAKSKTTSVPAKAAIVP